jgi:hypothetical protein
MIWTDIRRHYPHQWLLVEALLAHSEAGKRQLDELAVVDVPGLGNSSPWILETPPRRSVAGAVRCPQRSRRAGDHRTHPARPPRRRMKIRLEHGLAYLEVILTFRGRSLSIRDTVLDTGADRLW